MDDLPFPTPAHGGGATTCPLGNGYDSPRAAMGTDEAGPGGADEPMMPPRLASTVELLGRARTGDGDSLEELFRRYLNPLKRWAHGRLPASARGALDTQDLVQGALLRTLHNLGAFEPRHDGALLAYLRRAVLNEINDTVRRVARRPTPVELHDNYAATDPSPLAIAIGRQGLDRYEAALKKLKPKYQEAIIGRFELQYDYDELATILGTPNGNAARVTVTRALERLLEHMDYER